MRTEYALGLCLGLELGLELGLAFRNLWMLAFIIQLTGMTEEVNAVAAHIGESSNYHLYSHQGREGHG